MYRLAGAYIELKLWRDEESLSSFVFSWQSFCLFVGRVLHAGGLLLLTVDDASLVFSFSGCPQYVFGYISHYSLLHKKWPIWQFLT